MHLEPVWLLEALGAPIPTERCFRRRLSYPLKIGATDTCGSTCRRFTSSALAWARYREEPGPRPARRTRLDADRLG